MLPAHRAGELQIARGVAPGVELDGAKAAREALGDEVEVGGDAREHRRARVGGETVTGPAEQPVEGLTRPLRREVEERDLDGRDGPRRQRKHPRAELVEDRLARERVLSDENREKMAHRLRGVPIEVERGGVPHRPDPFSAIVRAHLHHDAGHELRRQIVRPGVPLHRRADAPRPDPLDPTHRLALPPVRTRKPGNIARRTGEGHSLAKPRNQAECSRKHPGAAHTGGEPGSRSRPAPGMGFRRAVRR